MPRVVLSLFALLTLTAFAPAPFPRSQRRVSDTDITLESFQGTWRLVSLVTLQPDGKHELYQWDITHVRIAGNRFDYLAGQRLYEAEGRRIGVDPTKKPAHFHFVEGPALGAAITGPGIIRRKGNRVEIVYTWGTPEVRSKSFETPTSGHWLLTLER